MTALWSHIKNEKELLSLCHAHQLSSAVFAALELGLFEQLDRCDGVTLEGLAESLDVPAENLHRLIRLLVAIGLLNEVGEKFRNAPVAAKSLVATSPESVRSVLLYQARKVYPAYTKLVEALRVGRTDFQPSNHGLYDQLDAEGYEVYLGGANFYSKGIGTALSQSIDFSEVKHVVDLGSGGGQVAQEMMEALPGISMVLVDRPEALEYLSSRKEIRKFNGRFLCLKADFLRSLPIERETADVVILSSVLGDWGKVDRSKILSNARTILKPGGSLLITETLLSEDGVGSLRTGVISVYVLLLTKGGDNYSASFWRQELGESGFAVEHVYRNADKGMRDIIVAKKLEL